MTVDPFKCSLVEMTHYLQGKNFINDLKRKWPIKIVNAILHPPK